MVIGHNGDFEQVYPLPRRFAEVDNDGDTPGVFYFHNPGDYLLGYLLCKETVQTAHYPFTTYKMKVIEARQDGAKLIIEDDRVIEFPGNVELRRLIDDNELIGSLVKLLYKGKKGQYKKYDVFKDRGTFYPNEEQQYGRSRKKRKRKTTGVAAAGSAGSTGSEKQGGRSAGDGRS
jgi:hypothetical protein